MKFSHSLQINTVPEWRDYYINYSHLKRLIYQLEKVRVRPENARYRELRQPSEAATPPLDASASETRLLPDETALDLDAARGDAETDDTSATFSAALDAELDRIVAFYIKTEKAVFDEYHQLYGDVEYAERLDQSRPGSHGRFAAGQSAGSPATPPQKPDATPRVSFQSPPSRQSSERLRAARGAFEQSATDLFVLLNELKDYVDLNYTGFLKSLKKYDKVLGSSLREWYMSNVTDRAYPFLPEVRERLQKTLRKVVQLAAYLSGDSAAASLAQLDNVTQGDLELVTNDLCAHLRSKIIFERNTIWREMIEQERRSAGIGVQGAANPLAVPQTPWFVIPRVNFAVPRPDRRFWYALGGCALAVAILLSPVFGPEAAEPRACLAILALAIVFWALEVIPLFVTSMLIPLLVVLLRVMRAPSDADPSGFVRLSAPAAAKVVFGSMFGPVIMLLLGGFTLAAALSKHHVAKSLASVVLSRAGDRPSTILLVNMAVACFGSMWISNVAAPVLCFSLIQPILRTLPPRSSYAKCLILGIALASNVGGMASPISSPQNIVALQNLSPSATWPQWLAVSVPLCTLCILAVWALLVAFFRPNSAIVTRPPALKTRASQLGGARLALLHQSPGPAGQGAAALSGAAAPEAAVAAAASGDDAFSPTQWFVIAVSLVTVALWIAESFFEDVLGDMGVVAMLPIVLFFGTGVLSKDDFNNFLWTVIFLAMGGISLGKAVDVSGLLSHITNMLIPLIGGFSEWQQLVIFSLLVGVMTTFVSHTVGALIILPIVASVGNAGADPFGNLLVMGCAFMCSAAMGLPVSSFPNMNAISLEDPTGVPWLTTRDFMRVGIIATAVCWLLVVSAGYVLLVLVRF